MPLNYCASLLHKAASEMVDRAATYDSPAGEQSMAKTVKAFNALTDLNLTEEQGWLFMGVLKKARSAQGDFREDNFIDEAAYAVLRAASRKKTIEPIQTKIASGGGVGRGGICACDCYPCHCDSLGFHSGKPSVR